MPNLFKNPQKTPRSPLFSGEDSRQLPFGPRSSKEMGSYSQATLSQVDAAIRAAGGKVWHLDCLPYGTMMRAEIGRIYIRLVKLKPGHCPSEIATEDNSKLLVISTLDNLERWLVALLATRRTRDCP